VGRLRHFGLAAAFTSTVWLAPVSTVFDKAKGMAIALTLCGAGISAAAGPPLAEYFIQTYNWRIGFTGLACFWCGLALLLVVAFVPRSRAPVAPDRAESGNQSEPSEIFGLT